MYQELTDRVVFATADIVDEFHYIMSCTYLKEREKYLPSYCCNNVNTFKFNELFASCNIVVQKQTMYIYKDY